MSLHLAIAVMGIAGGIDLIDNPDDDVELRLGLYDLIIFGVSTAGSLTSVVAGCVAACATSERVVRSSTIAVLVGSIIAFLVQMTLVSDVFFWLARGHCWGAPTSPHAGGWSTPPASSRVGRKLPLPMYADALHSDDSSHHDRPFLMLLLEILSCIGPTSGPSLRLSHLYFQLAFPLLHW